MALFDKKNFRNFGIENDALELKPLFVLAIFTFAIFFAGIIFGNNDTRIYSLISIIELFIILFLPANYSKPCMGYSPGTKKLHKTKGGIKFSP